MVILRNDLIRYLEIKGDLKNRLIDRFQKKPGDIREGRRNAMRLAYGPSQEERLEAEVRMYEEHVAVRQDHEV